MTITITGIDDVIKDYARGKKALQSKMGLVVKEAANALKDKIREQIDMMNAIDTGTLWNAIAARKVESYIWLIGDFDYPLGVLPYGIFVEYGSRRHFVPREYFFMKGEEPGGKMIALIIDLDSKREAKGLPPTPGLMIGPIAPRPYQNNAVYSIKPLLEIFFEDEIEKILPDFQGSLTIK